jgi:ATP-dependent DNA helicase RecQ
MSEDHQYNEAGDHAIVSASKSSTIDEVLMGMLRDLRKRVSKN